MNRILVLWRNSCNGWNLRDNFAAKQVFNHCLSQMSLPVEGFPVSLWLDLIRCPRRSSGLTVLRGYFQPKGDLSCSVGFCHSPLSAVFFQLYFCHCGCLHDDVLSSQFDSKVSSGWKVSASTVLSALILVRMTFMEILYKKEALMAFKNFLFKECLHNKQFSLDKDFNKHAANMVCNRSYEWRESMLLEINVEIISVEEAVFCYLVG